MLFFPNEVFQGASSGLLLWFQTVLPTLLPFLILVNIMQKTSLIRQVSRLVYPALGPLFSVSTEGCFAVLTGFLCDYQVGAKVTSDLVRDGRISRQEGAYLLSFCNNTSPGFLAGFVVCQTIRDPSLVLGTMIVFFAVPILFSFLFRKNGFIFRFCSFIYEINLCRHERAVFCQYFSCTVFVGKLQTILI